MHSIDEEGEELSQETLMKGFHSNTFHALWAKRVNFVPSVVPVWLGERNISVPINTDVLFWSYHYMYI